MRTFSSYGPVDTKQHYYVPRQSLVDQALAQLVGIEPESGGHYITIWASRQRGKTWIMQQVMQRLQTEPHYAWVDVVKLNLQDLGLLEDVGDVIYEISTQIAQALGKEITTPHTLNDFRDIFTRAVLDKPLILILDEFDALKQEAVGNITRVFRNIYISRGDEINKSSSEKSYLLHGVALVGVRSVLGVENQSGSPFNVQRSIHIPNLTSAEVTELFHWYEYESGQPVEQTVIDRIYDELQGQPGLTGWFGELLTETYNLQPQAPITLQNFEQVYIEALNVLPNSNITNLVSKARQEPYTEIVLSLFETATKLSFKIDDPYLSFLYLNGIIDIDRSGVEPTVKFANPFVQRRLFNAFSTDYVRALGRLYDPFTDLSDTITEESLNIKNLLRRYESYFQQHGQALLQDVPHRKSDLRVYEAIYHFHLYKYLSDFLANKQGRVVPEFPTGNGQIDLIIHYAGHIYGLEVKSFADRFGYKEALKQAARYANKLKVTHIWLAFFVETIDDANRQLFEQPYADAATGVTVEPIFIATIADNH